jgi:hypothetical protein
MAESTLLSDVGHSRQVKGLGSHVSWLNIACLIPSWMGIDTNTCPIDNHRISAYSMSN